MSGIPPDDPASPDRSVPARAPEAGAPEVGARKTGSGAPPASDRGGPRAAPSSVDPVRSDVGERPIGRVLGGAILALYVLSGAAGLVYEVAWAKRLSAVLGSTSVSAALVLAAFLGALGLGARFGGRLADRSPRPLLAYGVLELAAAAWAFAVPTVVVLLDGLYVRGASALIPAGRLGLGFVVAAIVVGPAAFALGATFPCVVRALARRPDAAGRAASLLYGANTLGAVAGALWAGFVGISAFGVTGTSRIAAGLSLLVAGAAFVLARRVPASVDARGTRPTRTPGARRAPVGAILVAALSGLLALGLEAAGLRVLVFFVEGFAASFAAMLGVFLLGLALGALLLAPLLGRLLRPASAVAALLVAAGGATLLLLAALPGFETVLDGVRDAASRGGEPVVALRRTALAGSILLFLAPSALLGAVYPLCVRWAVGDDDSARLGRRIGAVALANSAGAVLGPLLVLGIGTLGGAGDGPGGPLLAWAILGLVSVFVGVGVLLARLPRRGLLLPIGGVLAGCGLGFLGPTLVAGATPRALVEASRVVRDARGRLDVRRTLLEVRADETTTASVVELPSGERVLNTDAFMAAATGPSYPYMRLLGHLPALLAAQPARALVIAFGTGTTAGALAATSEVERLEIVEASRAVYAMASRFDTANRNVLLDARVVRSVDDGRHALLLHRPDLDVITLEPLMPYAPSATPFYTREFYELARDRLREGGVVCQWAPVHAMRPDLYAALLGTFFSTFPDGSLWFFEQSTILVGRKGSTAPAAETIVRRGAEIQRNLLAAGLRFSPALSNAYVASGRRVLAVLADPTRSGLEAMRTADLGPLASRIVTDDDPFPEAYPAPRSSIATNHAAVTLAWLAGVVDTSAPQDENPLAALSEGMNGSAGLVDGLVARSTEAAGDFRLATARDASERAAARAVLETAAQAYAAAAAANAGADRAVDVRRVSLSRRLHALSARARLADADAASRAGDAVAEASALDAYVADARRGYEIEPTVVEGTALPGAAALYAEALARAGRCTESLTLVRTLRRRWPREPEIAAVGAWLAARSAGHDAARAGLDEGLVARLALARACSDATTGRVDATVRAIDDRSFAGDTIAVRRLADSFLAGLRADDPAVAEIVARLRTPLDGARGGAVAERAALLARLAPTETALADLLRSTDRAVRLEALRAASYRGFEATGTLAVLRDELAHASDPLARIDVAETAGADASPAVLGVLTGLLLDVERDVRTAAWTSLSARVPAAEREGLAYDPAGSEAQREAGAARVRARLGVP